jgi:hypothetical protein
MASQIIIIEKADNGNISYTINPKEDIHSVVGALQLVRRVLEAQMVSEVLSAKAIDKTNDHDNQHQQSEANPS